MRQMWTRNRLSADEVDMVRGLCTAMIRSAGHASTPNDRAPDRHV
jgi:tRNA/rRNA methyltransferase